MQSPSAPTISNRRFASARVIVALILREMSTRYGRSPGGYIWAIVEPVAAIAVLAFGFSLIVRNPSLGQSFLLFYATGYIPFQIYQSVSVTVARSIHFSRPLLMYPSVTWVDAVLARFILNVLTSVLVSYMIFVGILMLTRTGAVVDVVSVVLAMSLAALLGLGTGVANCFLIGIYPTWDIIWSIITRPLLLISGVFFTFEDLPADLQPFLWFNPLMHISGIMREGFYPMYNTYAGSSLYVTVVSLVALTLGMVFLRRFHKAILDM